MYQLKNLIGRSAVPNNPEKNMNAAEDFMLLLVHAFVAAAAQVLQLEVPTGSVKEVAEKVIERFVHLPSVSPSEHTEIDDKVHLYATEVISLGLIWNGFHDAIKEGDGDSILRYWKIFLVVFKSTNH